MHAGKSIENRITSGSTRQKTGSTEGNMSQPWGAIGRAVGRVALPALLALLALAPRPSWAQG
jgi:hypothetical protein